MIIGGMFGLCESQYKSNEVPPFINGNELFLVNARSGIFLIIDQIKPNNVWLPSYLCDSIVETIRKCGSSIKYFKVTSSLETENTNWIQETQSGDLVILIDYFGFPVDNQLKVLLKKQGVLILEDASQALLTEKVGTNADFVLYSPRKFLGIPDGGILALNNIINFNDATFLQPPVKWWLKSLTASILRRDFDLNDGNRDWYQLFQESEATQPVGNFSMSDLSKNLILHSFDYAEIATIRKVNFNCLLENLNLISLYKHLPKSVVPIGFPVRIKNRDRVRQELFREQIYPPIHWPLDGIVPDSYTASYQLESEIMTLPCDQRYTVEDMERLAGFFSEELIK